MGVIWRQFFVLSFCVGVAAGAPKLRLSTTTIGPVSVATGQNAAPQVLDAANLGDGTLALTFTSTATWIVPAVTGQRPCTLKPPTCTAVQIGFNTAALARGRYTGVVTVNDPEATDAPQTITVTVQVGGGVPDSLTLFVPPDGAGQSSFVTNSRVNTTVTNPLGGPTLAVSGGQGGSFDFTFTYLVTARAPASTPDNEYTGSFAVTSSTFAGDIKTVPVRVRVTRQPIIRVSPSAVSFRIMQGAVKQEKWIFGANDGQGTLAVSTAAATTTSGGNWLTTTVSGDLVVATADPASLAPGTYQGQVAVASNAVNGTINVPVTLEVQAVGRPVVYYPGILDNALFEDDELAQGGYGAVKFGDQFSASAPVLVGTFPLPTVLGGASVFVNDVPAPLYYAAGSHVVDRGGQINFQVPYDTPAGEAVVRVDRDGQRGNNHSLRVVRSSPRILPLGIGQYGIVTVSEPNNSYSFAIPPTPGLASRRVRAGDVLTIWCFGLGPTDPPVVAGAQPPLAEPFARVADRVRVNLGATVLPGSGINVDPVYAGLSGFAALYQVSLVVPSNTPRGDNTTLYITVGNVVSNRVQIAVE